MRSEAPGRLLLLGLFLGPLPWEPFALFDLESQRWVWAPRGRGDDVSPFR